MIYSPIYKDVYYTSTSDSLSYIIITDGVTIYSGKAFKMPNQDSLKININKICQDYLQQDFEDILNGSTSITNHNACKDFILSTEDGTTLETYRFLYCWDYDFEWTRTVTTPLSVPVNGHYVSGQLRPHTQVSSGNNTVSTSSSMGVYNTVVCADYVLYYVNARGGWDAFAFEGRCKKTDSITQHNYNRAFNNTTLEFESGRYISEITTSYELNTGIMTEGEAAKFAKNLIGSNLVYLANISEGWVRPAVISDTSAEYKQEGEEDVITYKVTVKESQSKIRI